MARTDIDAQDYFGSQQKKLGVADRRPVIRKASDLVGPGINANAVRLTDFNNLLATYDGFFSAEDTALHAPGSGESYVGTVASDSDLGGMQSFSGLTTGTAWQRVFLRNPSDAATIYWGAWEIIGTAGTGGSTFLETLPASIIDAKGDLIVGAADNDPVRKAVGTDGQSLVANSTDVSGVAWANRVQSIIPAPDSEITVDNTDPLNPVIGSLGGSPLFINTDYNLASIAGSVGVRLTRSPRDGSLHVRWRGIDIPPTDWTLINGVVLFTNSHVHVGDELSVAYSYLDLVPDPFSISVVANPGNYSYGTNSGGGGTGIPIPLPAATAIGNLIVVSAISSGTITITDPRLTALGNNMWIGWATDLSAVSMSFGGSPWYAVTIDTFVTNASGWTAAQVSSNTGIVSGQTIAIPSISDVAATICTLTATVFTFGSCFIGTATGYTSIAGTNDPLASAINFWTGSSPSPAGTASYTAGGNGAMYATVIGLIGPV